MDKYAWHSPFSSPFRIDGMPFRKENGDVFHRLKVGSRYSEGVDYHAADTSGGRVNFSTVSEKLCLRALVLRSTGSPHISVYGSFGFDVSVWTPSGKRWLATVNPERGTSELEAEVLLPNGSKDVVVALPQYAKVESLFIGLSRSALLGEPSHTYSVKKPIVFYGSSITQGMSSSRSGTGFPALVAEHFNCDYINLGFAGSAKGEQCVAQDIAQIDMSAFIMEYDHNAEALKALADTHYAFYKTVRDAHKNIPIVMLSRISGGYSISETEAQERREIIQATYNRAKSNADSSVFFVNGDELSSVYRKENMLVDGVHPNDLGMRVIADAVIRHLIRGRETD